VCWERGSLAEDNSYPQLERNDKVPRETRSGTTLINSVLIKILEAEEGYIAINVENEL
jgi:hypothetical protein